jgi:hypothetical protein
MLYRSYSFIRHLLIESTDKALTYQLYICKLNNKQKNVTGKLY